MDLLKLASANSFSKSSYASNDMNLLIYTGVYRSGYVMEPAYASLLAGELDMNAAASDAEDKKTLAFDIFNGSVGFLNACFVAQQMIAAGNCRTAMIVAAETENNRDFFPSELAGIRETASALILDTDPANETGFLNFHFSYHNEFINAYTTYSNPHDLKPHLHISKDNALEFIYIDCILTSIRELFKSVNMDLSDIDMIFPPQLSSHFIQLLSEKMNVPFENFIDVAVEGPDLFTSSLPYAINYAFENKLVKKGDKGLIIAVGSGVQAGCAIYHF
jgi:3-oxoacyl-[acyl-carrier-protein] synthase III